MHFNYTNSLITLSKHVIYNQIKWRSFLHRQECRRKNLPFIFTTLGNYASKVGLGNRRVKETTMPPHFERNADELREHNLISTEERSIRTPYDQRAVRINWVETSFSLQWSFFVNYNERSPATLTADSMVSWWNFRFFSIAKLVCRSSCAAG